MILLVLNLLIIVPKPNLLFFTGGSNIMPKRIYSEFLSKFENDYNIIKNFEQIEENEDNQDSLLIGHSSGCITLLNYIKNQKNQKNQKNKNIVLIDPVKTLNFEKNINLINKNILILNTEFSTKWSKEFPYLPFIPFKFLLITKNDINIENKKIKELSINNFGHCDILNNPWRDFMHNSKISIGSHNRSQIFMENKYTYIKNIINEINED